MAGGSQQQAQPTSQTITQTNLPSYLEPFVTRVAGRAEEISNRPYEAYTGQRIADFNQDQLASQDMVRGLPGVYTGELNAASQTLDAARGLAGAAAGAFGDLQAQNINTAAIEGRRLFDAAARDQYMSPFLESNLDRLRASTDRARAEALARSRTQDVYDAPFGSSRGAVMESLLERDFASRFLDLEAQQRQAAFENAQGMFERDRRFGFDVDTGNAGRALEAARANQEASLRAATTRAQGLASLTDQINALAGRGLAAAEARRGMASADIDAMRRIGLDQQQRDQASLDLARQDFENQRDFERNQLTWYSNIVRGLPANISSDTTTFGGSPSPYSQVLGLATGATGLARAMSGGTV